MATIAEAFSWAANCAQAGQLFEAEQICRQILAADASHGDAWHLLGVISLQRGSPEIAAEALLHSITANPNDFEALNNLGIALRSLSRWDEAIERFRAAVAIREDFAEARYNLANALHEAGRIEEAIDSYRHALKFRSTDANIHNNLANALRAIGDEGAAIAAYECAIGLQPTSAEAHFNLANLYKKTGRDEAAINSYYHALRLNPQYAEAYSNLGAIFKDQERLDEAATCFNRALELKPLDAELHYNWACILLAQGQLFAATAVFDRVLQMQPDHSEAHFNRAMLRLQVGDFHDGWEELEWRWKTEQQHPRNFTQPLWQGEPLNNRTILLHAEQGFGDTIQFIRYASLVKQRGATVIVECPRPLLPLLAGFRGADQLVGQGDNLPPFDVHAPLVSLPRIFGTSVETIPAAIPYLFAEPNLVARWRCKLRGVEALRIGINWHGRSGRGNFRQRDIPLECFAELKSLPGVRLISLQKSKGQQDSVNNMVFPLILDFGDQLDQASGPFMDTAAILMNLDLLITSDTSVAHLGGALGVPVWLALPFAADWRWLLDRDDSPWYPTMRLFRQKTPGHWTGVFREITIALQQTMNETVR